MGLAARIVKAVNPPEEEFCLFVDDPRCPTEKAEELTKLAPQFLGDVQIKKADDDWITISCNVATYCDGCHVFFAPGTAFRLFMDKSEAFHNACLPKQYSE